MTTILVTGASGFIGRHVAAEAARRGDRVLALPGPSGRRAEIEGDVVWGPPLDLAAAAEEALEWARAEGPPDLLIHLAGFAKVGRTYYVPKAAFHGNAEVTYALLTALLATPMRPRCFLASSASLYGRVEEVDLPIREDRPPTPISPYAVTKEMAEAAGRFAARKDLSVVIGRFFNMTGPGQERGFVLADFVEAFRNRLKVLHVGNLDVERDFIDVRDGAEAILAVASRAETSPGEAAVFHIGSGRSHSLRWVLDRLMEMSGHRPILEYDPAKHRPHDVPRIVADVARLRALGVPPPRPLEETLSDMLTASPVRAR